MLPHISLKLLTSELMTWQRSLVSWCRCRHSICRTVRPIGTCATTRRHRRHPTEKKSIYKAFVCRTLDRVTAAVKFGSRSLALDLQWSPVFETTSHDFLMSTSYYLTVLEYFSVRHTAAAEHPRSPNNAVTLCRLSIGTCCTGRYLGCVAYVACAEIFSQFQPSDSFFDSFFAIPHCMLVQNVRVRLSTTKKWSSRQPCWRVARRCHLPTGKQKSKSHSR